MRNVILILVILICLSFDIGWSYGIVTNTATRDTLSFPCNPIDSVGSPVNLASGDSIYVMILFPGGAVAYRDSMAWDDASILRLGWEDFAETTYVFMERVSVIDGAGVDGLYRWFIKIQDLTDAALTTQYTGEFQIVNSTLESLLDSAGLAAATADSVYDSIKTLATISEVGSEVGDSVWGKADTAYVTNGMGSKISDSTFDDLNAIRDSVQYLVTATGFSTFDASTDSVIVDGSSLAATGDAITATTIATNAIGTLEWNASDEIWEYDTAGISGAQAIGTLIKDTLVYHLNFDPTSDSVIVDVSSATTTDNLVGHITDSVWDEVLTGATHNVQNSSGRRLRAVASDVITSGTAQAGAALSITLAAGASAVNDFYNGHIVKIIENTGEFQQKAIEDYDGGTKVASLHPDDDWTTNPDNTSNYEIIGGHAVEVIHLHTPPLDSIADAVWDEAVSGHTTANTYGDTLPQEIEINQTAITAIRDSVQYLVTATGTSTFDPTSDSVIVDVSSADAGLIPAITDTVWGHADSAWTANTMGSIVADSIPVDLNAIRDSLQYLVTGTVTDADMGAIADSVWDLDTVDAFAVNGSVGSFVKDSSVSSAASVSNAAMGSIADSVWDKIYADAHAVAGSMGDSLQSLIGVNDSIYDSIKNLATVSDIADSVWDLDTVDAFAVNGSVGSFIKDSLPTVSLTDAIMGAIADSVWDKDTVDAFAINGSAGSFLKDSSVGAAAPISDADMGAIGDTVWDKAQSDAIAVASSMGKHLSDSLNAIIDSLNNSATAGDVADSVWDKDTVDAFNVNGSVGSFVKDSSVSAAASITDADMAAISDSVWDKDTVDAFAVNGSVGSFVKDSSVGAAAPISDADMGAIADSVWDKIYADAIATGGGIGKFLSDSINSIIDSINNSATAGDVADSVWDKDTTDAFAIAAGVGKFVKDSTVSATASIADADMEAIMDSMSNRGIVQYDSTQATIKAAGLHLRASSNDTAFIAHGLGSGFGASFKGGPTAAGIESRGGSSTGPGISAVTGTSSPGIQSVSTTGPGILSQGKYGLLSRGQTSYGILAEGSKASGDSAGIAAVSGGTDPDILGSISNTNMANISDSVWKKTFSDFTGNAGSIGDALYDSIDALVSSAGGVANVSGQDMADIADSVLGHIDTGWTATTPGGKINAIRAYMDTLIYIGQLSVWLDGAAGNTDTDVGIDGTEGNPVSTIAAATTIAGKLNIQRIYLINSTSITLAQGYGSWEFIGIGINNTINFGSQDIDKSYFERVTVTGIQGGTELIYLNGCGISGADSLEVFAENCWLTGNNSLKLAALICFNQCKSAVPGNNTPQLDFASAGSTIGVNFRHYSGGIEVKNMTSDHTISLEGDGQIIVNANCASANITIRGNFTITDNGTTTAITRDAVFSRQEADLWVWSNADTTHVDSSDIGAWLVNNSGGGIDYEQVWYNIDTTNIDSSDLGDWLQNNLGKTSGTGGNAVTIFAVDTLGTDSAVTGVKLSIKALTGEPIAHEYTGSNGAFIFDLDTDTFVVSGQRIGYIWNVYDTIVVAGAQTDTLEGYNIVVGSPASDTLCRVYGYIHDVQGNPIEDVLVTATQTKSKAIDTCTNVILGNFTATNPTNSAGYFFIDLIRSACYNKSGAKYLFIGTYPNGKTAFSTKQAVPDSTTYRLTW